MYKRQGPDIPESAMQELEKKLDSLNEDDILILAGEPNRRVGIVLSGELEAYRPGPQGARIPITHMEPGGVLSLIHI